MVNRVHTPWGTTKTGTRAGFTPRPRFLSRQPNSRAPREAQNAATGFASCRAALGDCPWASSASRMSGRRLHHGRSFRHDRNRHRPGRHRDRNGRAEGRQNHGADVEAVGGLRRYRAVNHDHRLRDRETFRRLARRALPLRTGRMRTPWGGRIRGPLECERQRPRRFLRRAHAALGRSWQS